MTDSNFKYSVSSVEKLFSIIRILSRSASEISAADIATQLGESRNTIHRFLRTLEQIGYAEQNPSTKKYHLSYKFLGLSYDICNTDGKTNRLLPYLRMFSRQYNVSCCLYYYCGTSTYTVHTAYPPDAQSTSNLTGCRLPTYASAPGRILLSSFTDEKLEEYLDSKVFIPYTDSTIIEKNELRREIMKIRRQGYVILDSELVMGSYAIGFPIYDQAGRLAGSIALITMRENSTAINTPEIIEHFKEVIKNAL